MWRPDNWNKIKPVSTVDWETGNFQRGVEAGADAMLEALKSIGLRLDSNLVGDYWHTQIDDIVGYRKGWLVFIPEDKDASRTKGG